MPPIDDSSATARFRRLWLASAASNLADGVFKTGLPLIAVGLTRDAAVVAGVTLALTLPWALFALPAGVWIDRLDRRRVVVAVDVVRVLTLGALAGVIAAGSAEVPALLACAFVLGTCEAFGDTASSAMLPAIVRRDALERANARLAGTETVLNEFAGPPLAGVLLAAGTGLALGASTAAYAIAAASLLLLAGRYRAVRPAVPPRFRTELVEGVRWVWRQPAIRVLTGTGAVMAGAWSAWVAVLPLYMVKPGPGGLSTSEYGLLLTTLALGGLCGTVLAPGVQRRFGLSAVVTCDVLAVIAMVLTPALTSDAYAIGAAAFLGGAGSGMWNVVVVSWRQRLTPDGLLGRVSATGRLLTWGMMPVGAACAGAVAQLVDVRAAFGLAGAATVGLLFALPAVWRIDAFGRDRTRMPAHCPEPQLRQ
jgi:predicted MFS family arabinose efflux permease